MARRGPKPTGQALHGTRGGYVMHRRYGTPICEACRQAHITWTRAYKQRGKCAPGLGWPPEARRG